MRTSTWRASAVLVGTWVVVGLGCGTEPLEPDAGQGDAGPAVDASPADAGSAEDAGHDAGRVDAGELDASVPDAGPVDAGEVDAGSDAGPDAGPPDECTVVPQSGCADGEACRTHEWVESPPGTWMRVYRVHCEPAGDLPEHWNEGSCGGIGGDMCEAGLFCLFGNGCVRYCIPGGDPCPDFWSTVRNEFQEQRCNDVEGYAPFCDII